MTTPMLLGLMVTSLLLASMASAQTLDRFGGDPSVKSEATGFFRIEQIDGRWWFVSPDGNGFLSKGVNCVSFVADYAPSIRQSPYEQTMIAKHGDKAAWAPAAAARLSEWGFNTIGSWSDPEMWKQNIPYTVILDLASSTTKDLWLKGLVPDVFAPSFVEAITKVAAERCTPRKDDPMLIGYYSDNEMRWAADWRNKTGLLDAFLQMPEGSPGRVRAERIVADRRAAGEPTDGDEAAMQRAFAERYFSACHAAITAADANHMVLGCRFAGYAPEPVLTAMAPYVTVVSWNNYDYEPPIDTLAKVTQITGKPVMVTEFSFKADDSGLPNTKGAGKPLQTQQQRADYFEKYIGELLKTPNFIGFHWFQHADQPPEGRFDGENSNFGIVSLKDEPWPLLVDAMKRINADAVRLHLGK